MKTLLVIYQEAQFTMLEKEYGKHKSLHNDTTVLALGADVEFLLEKANIPFVSGRSFRRHTSREHSFAAEKMGRKILQDEQLSFFEHRGISLGECYTMALQDYLIKLFYHISIATSIFSEYSEAEIVLLPTTDIVLPTSGLMGIFEAEVVIDAFKVVYNANDASITVLETNVLPAKVTTIGFSIRKKTLEIGLFFLNLSTRLLPQKQIRILATEYWKNISPLMDELQNTELVLLDRKQVTLIGLKNIVRNRMRFMHVDSYIGLKEKKIAKDRVATFALRWDGIRHTYPKSFSYENYSIDEFLSLIIDRIIKVGGEQAVLTIEGMYRMVEKINPQIVLVRASISAQPHFEILCRVAAMYKIPSLEIQHGIFYLGNGSFIRRRAAEYIAEYGPLSRKELQAIGFTEEKLLDIGSPRFDSYANLPVYTSKRDDGICIGLIVPEVLTGSWNDTYDVLDFFTNFVKALNGLSKASVIIKLRPSNANFEFYKEAIIRTFETTPYTILKFEPISALFDKSDLIVTCYSTALLEVLMCGIPMVYDATLPMQDELGSSLDSYMAAGALMYAKTADELKAAVQLLSSDEKVREKYSQEAQRFMREKYVFDGHSSERLAAAIQKLAV